MPISNSKLFSEEAGPLRDRRHMNATLAHSTVERYAELVEGGPLANFVFAGASIVVEVRFSARGCSGDSGVERDLLNEASGRLGVAVVSFLLLACEAFAASVSDFSAALITCVANISLSFADSPASSARDAALECVREVGFAGARLVVLFVAILVADAVLDSGIRSSRRVTVVADVHVAVDDTAAFTASALVVMDVMGSLYTGTPKHIVTAAGSSFITCAVEGRQNKRKAKTLLLNGLDESASLLR